MLKTKKEFIIGVVFLAVLLIGGSLFLDSSALMFRLIIGLVLGYALVRSAFGFAGAANRAYTKGSTKLFQILMWLFLGSAAITAAFAFNDPTKIGLWINPINLGLVVGGLIFGVGMAFSMCCASGVLTDVVEGPTRGLVTLLFFGIGTFVGFPLAKTQSWVTDSLITSGTSNGVFLPDLFKWDGMNGFLGAMIVTALLCLGCIGFAKWYEKRRRDAGTYSPVPSEAHQEKIAAAMRANEAKLKVFSEGTFNKLFVNPWTLATGAIVIMVAFALLMGITNSGWGASTPYGWWFGRILHMFGVPASSLAEYTLLNETAFTSPFFANAMNIQNVSIILGSVLALLLSGRFIVAIKNGFKASWLEILTYAMGGFLMGFGTRLSAGCNVGAMYTPIANFSVSGWLYMVMLFGGGILGNMLKDVVFKKSTKSCCSCNSCDSCDDAKID